MKTKLLTFITLLSLSSASVLAANIDTKYVIEGKAEVQVNNLFTCKNGRSRLSPLGIKKDGDKEFIVPSPVQYEKKYFASDLYNECSNITANSLSEVDVSSVPVIEIDKNGEVVTGYIFADNYFELFINGKLVAIDPIPFTPFNSNIVKFKVKKPYDIAIKVVDWEENSGLGSENNRGKKYHAGDGGFIASFSDGTQTNSKWSAQTFYTAPVSDLNCVQGIGNNRITQDCTTKGTNEYIKTYSLHWDIPKNWKTGKEYLSWPQSIEYTEDEIGVKNEKAYMNFQDQFAGSGASFIWSSNLVLDNLVLLRYHVQ